MVAERAKGKGCLPREELSPRLHDAVQRVLDDRVPDALARRLVRSLHRQVAYYPRESRSRLRSLGVPLTCASVIAIALTALLLTVQTLGQASWLRSGPMPGEGVTIFSDDSPTAWAYSKAARQSPEALYALMDRHSHPSLSAASQWLAGTNTPSFTSSQAMP